MEAGRRADMCEKGGQPDGSGLSASGPDREEAQVGQVLPGGFHAAQPLGGWASALAPELSGEAGVAATGRRLLFLKFSN